MQLVTNLSGWLWNRHGHTRITRTPLRFYMLILLFEILSFLLFFLHDWIYIPNGQVFTLPITSYQSYNDIFFYINYSLYAVILLLWCFEYVYLSGWRRGFIDFMMLLNITTLVPAVVMLIVSLSTGAVWSRVWLPLALRIWSIYINMEIVIRILFSETWPTMVAVVNASMSLMSFLFTCGMVFSVLETYWASLSRPLVDSVYYTVITFSTVGYGDIHPTSWESRLAVIIMIAIALYRFPLFFSKVWQAFRLGTPSYRPLMLERSHIIIAGEMSAQEGRLLLNEFHSGVRSYANFHIVFLTPVELPRCITEELFNPILASRIQIIYGDPSSHQDIYRAAPESAQCVIFPTHVTTRAEVRDTASVLYANAFYSVDPNLPQHVSLVRADAVRQLTSGALATLSISEHLRGVFLGLLVALPGALSFIMGMTASHDSLIKAKNITEDHHHHHHHTTAVSFTHATLVDIVAESVKDDEEEDEDGRRRRRKKKKHHPMWIDQLDWSIGNNFFTIKCPSALCGHHFHEAVRSFQPCKVLVIGVISDTVAGVDTRDEDESDMDEFRERLRETMNEVTRRVLSSVHTKPPRSSVSSRNDGGGDGGGGGGGGVALPQTMTSVMLNPSGYTCHIKTQFVVLAQDQTVLDKASVMLHHSSKVKTIIPHTTTRETDEGDHVQTLDEDTSASHKPLPSSSSSSFPHTGEKDAYSICNFIYYSTDKALPKKIKDFMLLVDLYPVNTEVGDEISLLDQRLAFHRARDVHRIVRTIQMYNPNVTIVLLSRDRLELSREVRRQMAKQTTMEPQKQVPYKSSVIHMDGSGSSVDDLLRVRVWEARRVLVFSTGDNQTPMGDSAIVSVTKQIHDLRREVGDYLGGITNLPSEDPCQGFVAAEVANIETLSLIPPYGSTTTLQSLVQFGSAFELSLVTGHASASSLVHASLYQAYLNPFIGPVLTALTAPYSSPILQYDTLPKDASLELFIDVVQYYAEREAVALGLYRVIEDPEHHTIDGIERFMFVNPPCKTRINATDCVLYIAKI